MRDLPCCAALKASRASAAPSANGKAAERATPAQSTANVRLEKRAAGPHSCQTTRVNASAAALIVATASTLIPITAAIG